MLRSFVRCVLTESKLDDMIVKYEPYGSEDKYDSQLKSAIKKIYAADPSSTKKYFTWMCKQILGQPPLSENDWLNVGDWYRKANDVFPTIEYFDRHISHFEKRDINAYRNAKELEDTVKDVDASPAMQKKKSKEFASANAEKLYEDDDVLLVRPDDKNAVMKYGAGTKWCITMRDANYYEEYTDDNVLFYFLIDKNPDATLKKVAMAMIRDLKNNIEQIEFYDQNDKKQNQTYVIENFGASDSKTIKLADEKRNDKLIKLALGNALSRSKSLGSKIKYGDKVSDEDLFKYWRSKFSEKDLKITDDFAIKSRKCDFASKLSIHQQISLSKIDAFLMMLFEESPPMFIASIDYRGEPKEFFERDLAIRNDDNKLFISIGRNRYEAGDGEIVNNVNTSQSIRNFSIVHYSNSTLWKEEDKKFFYKAMNELLKEFGLNRD